MLFGRWAVRGGARRGEARRGVVGDVRDVCMARLGRRGSWLVLVRVSSSLPRVPGLPRLVGGVGDDSCGGDDSGNGNGSVNDDGNVKAMAVARLTVALWRHGCSRLKWLQCACLHSIFVVTDSSGCVGRVLSKSSSRRSLVQPPVCVSGHARAAILIPHRAARHPPSPARCRVCRV